MSLSLHVTGSTASCGGCEGRWRACRKSFVPKVIEYFCDSKVGHVYCVEVSEPEAAREIASLLVPLRFSYLTITCRGEPVLEMKAA